MAAAAGAGLRDALRRRPAGGAQAQSEPGAPKVDAAANRAAAAASTLGPFDDRVRAGRALDPGIERAGDPHAARPRASIPATGRSTRRRSSATTTSRGRLPGARRRGRAGADLQFDQRRARGREPEREPRSRRPCATSSPSAPPRRGHDLRLQRRPPARRRRGRRGLRPRGRRGRPRDGPGRRGRAASAATSTGCRTSARRRLRLPAARQGRGAAHRQPGRAARRPGPRSPTTSIPDITLAAGDRVIFSSRAIPGNERAVDAHHQRPRATRHRGRSPTARTSSTSPAIRAATRWRRCMPGPGRTIAIPAHGEALHLAEHAALRAGAGRAGAWSAPATARWCAWRPGRPRSSTTSRSGRLFRDGDVLVDVERPGDPRAAQARLRRHRLGRYRHRRAAARSPASRRSS